MMRKEMNATGSLRKLELRHSINSMEIKLNQKIKQVSATSVPAGYPYKINRTVNKLQVSKIFLLFLLTLGRNSKVTFCLDKESSSSECEEDFDRYLLH